MLYFEKYINKEAKKWVVLLHGFGANSRMWVCQKKALKSKFNLLIIDLPGHGKSKEDTLVNLNIKTLEGVADLIKDVLDFNEITLAHFISVSLGTLVFGGFYSKYPQMVENVIMSGVILRGNKFLEFVAKCVDKLFSVFPYMFFMRIFAYFLLPLKSHKVSRDFFINAGKSMGKSEFIAWFELGLRELHIFEHIDMCKKEMLIIMGSQDFVFLNGAKQRLTDLKNATLRVIDNCGHVCNIQKHKEFNNLILNYLAS